MNVLFLSELFYPHGGGAELATHLYAKLLSEAGLNVIVITNKFAGESAVSKRQNLMVYRLPGLVGKGSVKYSILRRFDVLFSSFVRKKIRWADVVYVPRFWYSAIHFAKLYKKPVVVHLHDYIAVCPLSNLYNMSANAICARNLTYSCSTRCIFSWEKAHGGRFSDTLCSMILNPTLGSLLGKSVRLSDAVICVSRAQRDILLKSGEWLPDKICTIYNPLPDVNYASIEEDDFGYFGGPNRLKGFHILYKALKSMSSNKAGKINVHVTGFHDLPPPYLNSLHELGFITYEKLRKIEYERLYTKIRVAIVPSVWQETFSYVTVEALLNERIVIASEIGAIPEVTNGCDGVFLFPAGDYEQLRDTMLYVKDLSRDTLDELGKKNRENVTKKFSNERSVNKFIRLLRVVSHN